MYIVKVSKVEEMLDGRSTTYLADKIGISRVYLSNILNGKKNISKVLAYCIVKSCDKDAELEEYFERVK